METAYTGRTAPRTRRLALLLLFVITLCVKSPISRTSSEIFLDQVCSRSFISGQLVGRLFSPTIHCLSSISRTSSPCIYCTTINALIPCFIGSTCTQLKSTLFHVRPSPDLEIPSHLPSYCCGLTCQSINLTHQVLTRLRIACTTGNLMSLSFDSLL